MKWGCEEMAEKKREACRECFPDAQVRKTVRESTSTKVNGILVRKVVKDSGTRCMTHWRAEKNRRTTARHDTYVVKTYGLGTGEYRALYEAQGGHCAICTRATGASRKLSVDHDHASGLARGLLCRTCNDILGHARDNIEFFRRAVSYLTHPPAQRVLGQRHYQEPTTKKESDHDHDPGTTA